ncbi:BNR repeat-containing protein [Leadbetterella sp. DM7]|uniref:BNR repeat-containing protein n=1 Tax=Leadbetterella sp. DM7 TaxID=3235085 RepID=UPI00349EDBDA
MVRTSGSILALLLFFFIPSSAQKVRISEVADGWAQNSVNTVIFRKNALVTVQDVQFIAFYDAHGKVIAGKRNLQENRWELQDTGFTGNARDAHCSISIMADGRGYLHLSWGHHGQPLRYARSKAPFSLEFSPEIPMTGRNENHVTYPEFFKMPNGGLLFMYRDGSSGKGNLVINTYDLSTQRWEQLHSNLIDGEGKRNAYWQSFTDSRGVIHISWVWRETPDVATNHDMCYARSADGGKTWEKSTGEKYTLPINAATAEYIYPVPQRSELINQTSMFADKQGRPFIATYWRDRDSDVPQYRLIYNLNGTWKSQNLGFRKTPFSLSGVGTKRIPVSRPQVIGAWKNGALLIFRDEERGNKVSLAINKNLRRNKWKIKDLLPDNVGSWEPTFDTELWKDRQILSIFIQKTDQADLEGRTDMPAQRVKVADVRFKLKDKN